jgi:hypothetical protein
MKNTISIAITQTKLVVTDSLSLFTGIASKVLSTSKNKTVNNLFWSLILSDSVMWAFIILTLGYVSMYLGHALHGIVIRH